MLLIVAHGWFTAGPRSSWAQFERDTETGLARAIDMPIITEADLTSLPLPVQRYLRLTGIVGLPRVQNYRVRFRGRIRSAPDTAWMPFVAEQQSFADDPTRLFFMRAHRSGVPIEIFHRLAGGHATMQVKLFGAIPIVDARGEEMDRAETVTLFNDMCLLAPGTLLDKAIVWEPVDMRSAHARFSNRNQTIAATLMFGDDGLLTNFVSDDRRRSSPDGKTFTPVRFSTPVRDYRAFGTLRLATHGDARWLLPEGEFVYGEVRHGGGNDECEAALDVSGSMSASSVVPGAEVAKYMTVWLYRNMKALQLSEAIASGTSVRVLDVRTPGEFENRHIPGAYNVPLDQLAEHAPELRAVDGSVIVLVCQSGQRANRAEAVLHQAGMSGVHVLEGGMTAWMHDGRPTRRTRARMSLERQVRIAAGTLVALGSLAALLISPLLAAVPAVIGSGLVFAGITDTCAMGMLLAKLPYNRAASCDTESIVRRFVAPDKPGLP